MVLDLLFPFLILFLQITLHELTHAFFIVLFGQKILSIKLYPHKTEAGWAGGSVLWKEDPPLPKTKLAIINLSPIFMGIFVFAVTLGCCYYFGFSRWLWIIAQIGMLDSISNILVHFYKKNEFYDYTKGMTQLGFSKFQQTFIAIISILFLSGVLVREFLTNML